MKSWMELFANRSRTFAGALSALFSNFGEGSRKMGRPGRARIFTALARSYAASGRQAVDESASVESQEELHNELAQAYQKGMQEAQEDGERGILRCLTWGKKVTTIQRALLQRYAKQAESMQKEGQNFYVCEACGFIFLGEDPPAICPVCKAPQFRFSQVS